MSTQPKARPLLMNGEMVLETLNNNKTMTRRVVKPQPAPYSGIASTDGDFAWPTDTKGCVTISCKKNGPDGWAEENSPFGQIGDLLYVRENWKIGAWNEFGSVGIDYPADGFIRKEWLTVENDDKGDIFNRYWLQCAEDCEKAGLKPDQDGIYHFTSGKAPTRTRSSIHMPRWASRLTLRITGVHVEQLQAISDEDALKEGIEPIGHEREPEFDRMYIGRCIKSDCHVTRSPALAFKSLWTSIDGEESWKQNPWVWVIEFEVIHKNVDEVLKCSSNDGAQ